jgi:hypothetical protein
MSQSLPHPARPPAAPDKTSASRTQAPSLRKTADDVLTHLLALLRDLPAGQTETGLALIGALAGHAAAEIGWARRCEPGTASTPPTPQQYLETGHASGARLITGAWIDEWLCETQLSFAQQVLDAARDLGATDLPDLAATEAAACAAFGTETFGRPNLPAQHSPELPPLELLRRYGPHFTLRLARDPARPGDIPLVLGLAAQSLMERSRSELDPGLAALVLIDYAWPVARTHPDDI